MSNTLSGKHILVGVTGGIAAYKSPDLVRKLKADGAKVKVVMTKSAQEFISALTLQAVSGEPVRIDLFDNQAEAAMGHIELARWADAIVIAPASADCIAKISYGMADDLLTTLCLATSAKLAIAPAMNEKMWHNPITQENLEKLKQRGITILGPDSGEQACGDIGLGRMLAPEEIVKEVSNLFTGNLLSGVNVLLTVGATQEAMDPVRYLTNHSSGKMGQAMAQALLEEGANVTLVSGQMSVSPPSKVTNYKVTTAEEMLGRVLTHIPQCDIFIAAAAVADYRPANISPQKLEKSTEQMTLTLVKNPDILQTVASLKSRPLCVGFAAQTDNVLDKATAKRLHKKADIMIANQVGIAGQGFGADDNQATIITDEKVVEFPLMSKRLLAKELVGFIADYYQQSRKITKE